MSEAVTKTIVGQCEEIEQKPGSEWVKFKINVGSKYPVGLSTKVEKIIEEARAVGSEIATWTFKERESDQLNENTGKPFVNRYLDKVVVSGNEPTHIPPQGWEQAERDAAPHNTGVSQVPQRPAAGEHAPLAVGDRERSIVRQTCLKVAGQLFSGQGNVEKVGEGVRDNVGELIAAAARLEMWVYRDIDDVPFE